jgi:hypothetical protein
MENSSDVPKETQKSASPRDEKKASPTLNLVGDLAVIDGLCIHTLLMMFIRVEQLLQLNHSSVELTRLSILHLQRSETLLWYVYL